MVLGNKNVPNKYIYLVDMLGNIVDNFLYECYCGCNP